jgi:hypothetical protein
MIFLTMSRFQVSGTLQRLVRRPGGGMDSRKPTLRFGHAIGPNSAETLSCRQPF